MNASSRTVYLSAPTHVDSLHELDRVQLLVDIVDDEGRRLEAGRRGTVVAVWAEGAAYEVDFSEPIETNATVEAEKVERFA